MGIEQFLTKTTAVFWFCVKSGYQRDIPQKPKVVSTSYGWTIVCVINDIVGLRGAFLDIKSYNLLLVPFQSRKKLELIMCFFVADNLTLSLRPILEELPISFAS